MRACSGWRGDSSVKETAAPASRSSAFSEQPAGPPLGAASILLWDRNTESFGAVSGDNFALFVNLVLVVVGILHPG